MKQFASIKDIGLDPEYHLTVQKWLDRGDGCAVYENAELGHPELGHRKFVSFGSPAAQIESNTPPDRLPDMGGQINWRYWIVGVLRQAVDTNGGPVLFHAVCPHCSEEHTAEVSTAAEYQARVGEPRPVVWPCDMCKENGVDPDHCPKCGAHWFTHDGDGGCEL